MRRCEVLRERALRDKIFILQGEARVDKVVTMNNHRAIRERCRMVNSLTIGRIAVHTVGYSCLTGLNEMLTTTLDTRKLKSAGFGNVAESLTLETPVNSLSSGAARSVY